jgi:hypothetical protein
VAGFNVSLDDDRFCFVDQLFSAQSIAYKQESEMLYKEMIESLDGANKLKLTSYTGGTTSRISSISSK